MKGTWDCTSGVAKLGRRSKKSDRSQKAAACFKSFIPGKNSGVFFFVPPRWDSFLLRGVQGNAWVLFNGRPSLKQASKSPSKWLVQMIRLPGTTGRSSSEVNPAAVSFNQCTSIVGSISENPLRNISGIHHAPLDLWVTLHVTSRERTQSMDNVYHYFLWYLCFHIAFCLHKNHPPVLAWPEFLRKQWGIFVPHASHSPELAQAAQCLNPHGNLKRLDGAKRRSQNWIIWRISMHLYLKQLKDSSACISGIELSCR